MVESPRGSTPQESYVGGRRPVCPKEHLLLSFQLFCHSRRFVIPEQSGIHDRKSSQNKCSITLEQNPKLILDCFSGMRVDMGIRLRGCDGKSGCDGAKRLCQQPRKGLVDKPYSQLCRVLVPSRWDCDLTRKCMSDNSGRSHVFAQENSKDLPQLHKRTFSTSPKRWGTGTYTTHKFCDIPTVSSPQLAVG